MSKKVEVTSDCHDNFKKLFKKTADNYFGKKWNRKFEIDDFNSEALNIICCYFSDTNRFNEVYNGDYRKGIILFGNVGVGKTSVFKILDILFKKFYVPQYTFKFLTARTIISEAIIESNSKVSSEEFIIQKYSKPVLYIDDISRNSEVRIWGKNRDFIEEILLNRYDLFCKNGKRTFVSTNLTIDEFTTNFSPAMNDRLFDMFNFIELPGKSRRK